MYGKIKEHLQQTINEIREAGLYKSERVIETPQEARIEVNGRVLWQKPVRRSLEVLLEDSRTRADRSMVFSARVTLNLP